VTALESALEYANQGWRVIPILPGEKRPALTRWTEQATTDAHTIKEWWDGHDDYGVGIATGPGSGFWVLDVDDYESFRDLELRYEALPATRTSITGSGGYHFLFRWPDDGRDIRNDAGKRLGPGLDVRGDGGQIVAPPSLHPSGRAYEWDAGEPDEISEAPEWLLDLVTMKPAEPAVERVAATSSDRGSVHDVGRAARAGRMAAPPRRPRRRAPLDAPRQGVAGRDIGHDGLQGL